MHWAFPGYFIASLCLCVTGMVHTWWPEVNMLILVLFFLHMGLGVLSMARDAFTHWASTLTLIGDLTKLSALSISWVVNFSAVFKQCAYSEQLCRNAGPVCGGCCVIVWMPSVDAGFGKPKLRSFWVSYISPPCSLICVFVFSSIYIFISENNSFNQLYFLTLYTFYKIYTWVFWYFHVIERAVVYLLFQIPMAFVGKQDRNLAL